MPALLYILAGTFNLCPIQSTQQMATRLIFLNPASNHIITLSIIYNNSLFIKQYIYPSGF